MSRSRFALSALTALLVAVLAVVPASAKDRTITIDLGDPDEDGLSLSLSGGWLANEFLSDVVDDIDCDDRQDRDMERALLHLRKKGEGAKYTIRDGDETVQLSRRKGKLEFRKTEPGEKPTYVSMPWAMGECMLGNPKPMRKLGKDFEMSVEKEGSLSLTVD